jgi:hypothetical protein
MFVSLGCIPDLESFVSEGDQGLLNTREVPEIHGEVGKPSSAWWFSRF